MIPTDFMFVTFYLILLLLAVGGIASLALQKFAAIASWISTVCSISASALGIGLSVALLRSNSVLSLTVPTSFPFFTISLHIDGLSAYFFFIISLISITSSLYGLGYMKPYYQKHNAGIFGFFYNFFILSLFLVTSSYNGLYFLFVWEIMSLTSLALVVFENEDSTVISSGYLYFIMTHIATAFISVAFLLIYTTIHSFDFVVIREQAAMIPEGIQAVIFICSLIGLGTKAGIIPFHIWLPRAHSAAPSHVSSLMSGVMIKMAIFMFFRMFLDLIPSAPLWFGITVLLLGGVSSLLGVLYAIAEHDIKRLLAYHSIENIGIILLGFGTGLIFLSMGNAGIAALAFTASLFHTLNHAVFKSLLFLAAGSVISQTHTRNMEEYGGLIKRMPYTALFFLIGAVAISALPPFNGFVSEWLTFQSLINGISIPGIAIKSVFIFVTACLAFTGGLAAACFVKAFGVTFLARPRGKEATHARETSIVLVTPMLILSVLCLVLGIFSWRIVPVISEIVAQFIVFPNNAALTTATASIYTPATSASLHMPLLLVLMLIGIAAAWSLVKLINPKQKETIRDIWDCGYSLLTPRMEITATGFSRSLVMIFKSLFRPSHQQTVEYIDADIPYFSKSRTVTVYMENLYEKHIYYPLHTTLYAFSLYARKIQGGNLNFYLLYIFIMLLILLTWARYSV